MDACSMGWGLFNLAGLPCPVGGYNMRAHPWNTLEQTAVGQEDRQGLRQKLLAQVPSGLCLAGCIYCIRKQRHPCALQAAGYCATKKRHS